MQKSFEDYEISDDPTRIELDAVSGFLGRSYWAANRSRDAIAQTIGNSLCFGAYQGAKQVAFARVVTDSAVMYWLCDVWVAEDHRGRGLGKALIEAIVTDPRLSGLAGILATQDAHELYERYGFKREGQRFMYRLAAPPTT